MKRKGISPRIRFEVFKRDSFRCQYCGRCAPDVVLHVDHIEPVAGGGKDDLLNYVTSCADCNSGKGARRLSDDTVVMKQRRALEDLNERRNQLRMMAEWRNELLALEEEKLKVVAERVNSLLRPYRMVLSDAGTGEIRTLLKKYEVREILEGVEASRTGYLDRAAPGAEDAEETAQLFLEKIGGCTVVAKRLKSEPWLRDAYRLRALMRSRYQGIIEWEALEFLCTALSWGASPGDLREIVLAHTSFRRWVEEMAALVDALSKKDGGQ